MKVSLNQADAARLRALAERLDMEPSVAAGYLLKAAVEALMDEEKIILALVSDAGRDTRHTCRALGIQPPGVELTLKRKNRRGAQHHCLPFFLS